MFTDERNAIFVMFDKAAFSFEGDSKIGVTQLIDVEQVMLEANYQIYFTKFAWGAKLY